MVEVDNNSETQNIDVINSNLVDANVHFFGDKTTIAQIVQLLAYVRHAIQYNEKADIVVQVGHKIMNTPFSMTVNDQEISDYVTQKTVEIN